VERRRHEVGVRKALGAGVARVFGMLMMEVANPILFANVLAIPLAVAGANVYLSVFIQRSSIEAWPFVLTLAITLVVASLAGFAHVLKLAKVSPASILRCE